MKRDEKYLKGFLALFAVTFLLSASSVLAQSNDKSKKDIVETAVAAGQFTTLAKALRAADPVEVLKGGDKHTVFAPTGAAFAKLRREP